MVRVLHVLGGLNLGGAESRIMDLYRHIDREQVQFDFLVHVNASDYARASNNLDLMENYRTPQYYDDEVKALGGHIYALPRYRGVNHLAYKSAASQFFKSHHDYNVVQGHMTSTASIYLAEAHKYSSDKAPYMFTVAHTRNAGTEGGVKGIAVKTLRKNLPSVCDRLFACSHLAGDETFSGASYTYIPNTIDTDKYVFNASDRSLIREMYDIPDDTIVIGNVARFAEQKNQAFLIRAFSEMRNHHKAKLLLCGDGEKREECEALAHELSVADDVVFAGNQSEVWAYYSAMDIFAFPSVYEGMPGVVVEAQTSGLKCLISDTITTDVMVTDRIMPLSIRDTADWARVLDKWIDEFVAARAGNAEGSDGAVMANDKTRARYVEIMKKAGFDVAAQAEMMTRFYLDPLNVEL